MVILFKEIDAKFVGEFAAKVACVISPRVQSHLKNFTKSSQNQECIQCLFVDKVFHAMLSASI